MIKDINFMQKEIKNGRKIWWIYEMGAEFEYGLILDLEDIVSISSRFYVINL